jgi:hypothetical protein
VECMCISALRVCARCLCVCLSVCNICPIFFSLLFCSVFASPPTPRYLVLPPIAPKFRLLPHSHAFIHSFILSSFLGLFLVALFSHSLSFSLSLSLSLTLACLLAFFLSSFLSFVFVVIPPSSFLLHFILFRAFPSCSLSINPFLRLEIGLGVWIFFFLVGFPLPSLIACQALARMSPLFVCLYFGFGLFCFFFCFCISGFLSGTFRWCGI